MPIRPDCNLFQVFFGALASLPEQIIIPSI